MSLERADRDASIAAMTAQGASPEEIAALFGGAPWAPKVRRTRKS